MHKVTVCVNEEDVLKRVGLLNAAIFRVLSDARLIHVALADYEAGRMEVIVRADTTIVPDIAPGEVTVRIERISALAA
jgi:hypothetical protein